MTNEESRAQWICCLICDKKKCGKKANDCDVKKCLENKKMDISNKRK